LAEVAKESDMSAVLLALFNEPEAAGRVRTRLVRDGFPTDRVELTSLHEQGRASVLPAASTHDRLLQYFRALMKEKYEQPFVQALAERIEKGAATVAVHPRGSIETARAAEILDAEGAVEVVAHDLSSQTFERAAGHSDGYWVRHFMLDNPTGADCIYCRLFPGHEH
jgi:hypothetical protein